MAGRQLAAQIVELAVDRSSAREAGTREPESAKLKNHHC
jgi:hypothetical protein